MNDDITVIMGGSGVLGRKVAPYFGNASNWSMDTGVDCSTPESLALACGRVIDAQAKIGAVINCVGFNDMKTFDEVKEIDFAEAFSINAVVFPRAIRVMRLFGVLRPGAVLCNVTSNAARVPMTHSMTYNASKAAAEMITRQMARELKEYTIFGVSPNKLAGTRMGDSVAARVRELRGWTEEQERAYQLAAIPAGVETPVDSVASFIFEMMRPHNHPYITGNIFSYGGPTW